MSYHWKAMIVVMVVTTIAFMVAKPLMVRFMSTADFAVRRNVWLTINAAAFLIPNYWGYVAVAAVVMSYGMRRDSNPAAFYVFLLLAMAPLELDIPTLGAVRQIFRLDHFRLMSLVLLVPLALRLARHPDVPPAVKGAGGVGASVVQASDLLIVAYAVLQIALLVPYESVTTTMRRTVLLGLDMLLPYYVLSRACRSRAAVVDVMAAFVLSLALLVPLAVYEVVSGTMLYAALEQAWGTGRMYIYLSRAGYLRAQVTSGHSIVLGYAMATALGLWLYLQTRVAARGWRWLGLSTFVLGLILPFSRGPWLGALLILLLFLGLGPNPAGRLLKALGGLTVAAVIVLASPYGEGVLNSLPFIGTMDEGTVSYRQELAAQSWILIQQNPFFGTPGFWAYLEDLRQGQGIIDLVNAYAGIALAYGLVGLSLFLAFFASIVWRNVKAVRALSAQDPDLSLIGSSLLACMLGGLFMVATVNLYLSVSYITWALAGLAVSYLAVAKEKLTVIQEVGEGPLPQVRAGYRVS